MRRALATLGLVVFALCAFPSRADAYFWWWLDDLSGPSYKGWQLEWQVWCRTEDARMTPAYLKAASVDLSTDRSRYATAQGFADRDSDSASLLKAAVASAEAADKFVEKALSASQEKKFAQAKNDFDEALKNWQTAERQFQDGTEAAGFHKDRYSASVRSPEFEKRGVGGGGGAGFTVSLCSAAPFQRTNRFVALTFGWAGEYEAKEDRLQSNPELKKTSTAAELRLITLGVAFHSVVKPYLTVGAEAGLASFSSKRDPSFQKLYVKPVIVDLVPLAMGRHPNLGSPWRHVIHVRGFYTVFPTGFKQGSFTFDQNRGQSEQFRAEMIPGWGLDFDLTPIIRKWQGKW